jgi:hypothetical protein
VLCECLGEITLPHLSQLTGPREISPFRFTDRIVSFYLKVELNNVARRLKKLIEKYMHRRNCALSPRRPPPLGSRKKSISLHGHALIFAQDSYAQMLCELHPSFMIQDLRNKQRIGKCWGEFEGERRGKV